MTVLTPSTPDDVLAAVRDAVGARRPLAIRGHGTKAALGHAVDADTVLDLSGLSGVTLYEPDELVLSAFAGTPLADIVALLDAKGQELAFEPPLAHRALGAEGAGTIGGAVMVNAAGPRRLKAGAARDHVLGVKAVSGRGEAFKAGGRVVKNVTGYDLSKGLAGSFGTLAVATEVTVKVLPKAETATTLVLSGLADRAAVAALCQAMGAPVEASGAAHLPIAAARRLGFSKAATLVRLEGVPPSVDARFERLAALFRSLGPVDRLGPDETARIWAGLRDGEAVSRPDGGALWRVSVEPTAGPAIVDAVTPHEAAYDWSGGLVTLAFTAGEPDAGATRLRAAVKAVGGGHATLLAAPGAVRDAVPAFHPEDAPVAALSRRLKAEFDPLSILNPGRMGGGR